MILDALQTFAWLCLVLLLISTFCLLAITALAVFFWIGDRLFPRPQARRTDGLLMLDPDVIVLDQERAVRRPRGAA